MATETITVSLINPPSDNILKLNNTQIITGNNNTNNPIEGFTSSEDKKNSIFLKRSDTDISNDYVQINTKMSGHSTDPSLYINGIEVVTASNITDIAGNFISSTGDINIGTTQSGADISLTTIDSTINICGSKTIFYEQGQSESTDHKIVTIDGSTGSSKLGMELHRNFYLSYHEYSITSAGALTFQTNRVLHIFNMDGNFDATCVIPSPSDIGQILNIIFNKAQGLDASKKLELDFGSGELGTVDKFDSRYLEFTKSGQSCSLISIGNKWTILNTGATILSG